MNAQDVNGVELKIGDELCWGPDGTYIYTVIDIYDIAVEVLSQQPLSYKGWHLARQFRKIGEGKGTIDAEAKTLPAWAPTHRERMRDQIVNEWAAETGSWVENIDPAKADALIDRAGKAFERLGQRLQGWHPKPEVEIKGGPYATLQDLAQASKRPAYYTEALKAQIMAAIEKQYRDMLLAPLLPGDTVSFELGPFSIE